MQDHEYEKLFTIHCLIRTLALVVIILTTVFLLSDLVTDKIDAIRYICWVFGLSIGIFVYFYVSDSYVIEDDEEQ